MSRRGRGEGSVYRDGEAWVARIDLPIGPDGKRRQRKRRVQTKSEAHKVLRELQTEAAQLVDPDGVKRTVAEAVEAFLDLQPMDRAPKTIEMERWRASIVVKGLGQRRLGKLTVTDCDEFLARAASGEFGRRPLGREATRRVRSLLVNVLRNELRTGTLLRNVADLSVLPSQPAREVVQDDEDGDSSSSVHRALTYDEFRELWRAARWPLLVVVDLCGRNGLLGSLARVARFCGVTIVGATQYPSAEVLDQQIRTQLTTRIMLRVASGEQVNVCLGQGYGHSISPTSIGTNERGGLWIVGSPDAPRPVRARAHWVSDTDVANRVAETRHLTPPPGAVFATASEEPTEEIN